MNDLPPLPQELIDLHREIDRLAAVMYARATATLVLSLAGLIGCISGIARLALHGGAAGWWLFGVGAFLMTASVIAYVDGRRARGEYDDALSQLNRPLSDLL